MLQLFKHTKLRVAFQINNSVWKLLRSKIQLIIKSIQIYIFTTLRVSECAKRNIQNTVENFSIRFNERVKHFASNVVIQNYLITCLKKKYAMGIVN